MKISMYLKFGFWFLYLSHITIFNSASSESEVDKRLINAPPAQKEDFPFVGKLGVFDSTIRWKCTASLLNEETIITSAHCFCENEEMDIHPAHYNVSFGSVNSSDTEHEIQKFLKEVIVHPTFLADEFKCQRSNKTKAPEIIDVALAKLGTPIRFSKFVKPIKLSPLPYRVNRSIIHAGYGNSSKLILMYGKALINYVADKYYSSVKSQFCKFVCCFGDSGGPMLVGDDNGEPILGGVIAGGKSSRFSVYARSDKIYDWANNYSINYKLPKLAAVGAYFKSKFSTLYNKALCDKHNYKING